MYQPALFTVSSNALKYLQDLTPTLAGINNMQAHQAEEGLNVADMLYLYVHSFISTLI